MKRKSERYYATEWFFDKETEALIDLNVIYGAGKHITDKCMIIFSKEIHTYLVSHYKCEIIGEIGACNGNISIYCLDYKGEKIAFYLTGIGSAVASSMCYERVYERKNLWNQRTKSNLRLRSFWNIWLYHKSIQPTGKK